MSDDKRWMVDTTYDASYVNGFDCFIFELIRGTIYESDEAIDFIIELVHHIRDLQTENIALRDDIALLNALSGFQPETTTANTSDVIYDNITEAVRKPIDAPQAWVRRLKDLNEGDYRELDY